MKIIDVINEIKEKDFTDDNRLWFEGIDLKIFNPDKNVFKNIFIEDSQINTFEYNDLEIIDYYYRLDDEYLNFVIIKCGVLLKEVLK